ncbi:MAG: peroxiredoxin [Betaproteobacteria bacterium]|nr:peroxiredoxin [Betaproteobacteria bacterium]
MKDLSTLPEHLPIPVDDGACAHLPGTRMPSLPLLATSGDLVDLGARPGTTVIYFYPMIGRPDGPPLAGWNEIPGARGCTPQSCAFRDRHAELKRHGAEVFGASAQSPEEQREAKARLGLPFELLHDGRFTLSDALRLPTFAYAGTRRIKRLTLVSIGGVIRKVFYPAYPPDRNADDVIGWLERHRP